jgi:hypothetical protein
MSIAILGEGCECVAEHSPHAYIPNQHHVLPRSWGGQTVDTNLVTICDNTHRAVHRLIDDYVRAGGDPGWETRRHFSAYQRDLALRAWNQRPAVPTITSELEPHG